MKKSEKSFISSLINNIMISDEKVKMKSIEEGNKANKIIYSSLIKLKKFIIILIQEKIIIIF